MNQFDHPCKETCSGWLQGYECGKAKAEELLRAVEGVMDQVAKADTLDFGALEKAIAAYKGEAKNE